MEGIDGGESLTIEDWVPGTEVRFDDPAATTAVGEFDALLYLRTLEGTGADARALYDRDLHVDNMKVYLEDGRAHARAIDFDPEFTFRVTPDQFFGASIARRVLGVGFVLKDARGYLRGLVDAFAREPGGSREAARTILRRVRDGLRDPEMAPVLLEHQSLQFVTPLRAASVTADAIDAYLAAP